MIEELTGYVASQLSLTLGTNIFSRNFQEFSVDACCLYDGRFSPKGSDPAELVSREIIAEARGHSPGSVETLLKSVCDLLINRSELSIVGVSSHITITGSMPRLLPDKDDNGRFRYVAELVVTYK